MHYHPKPLADLIRELQKLPSVGAKTAQRLAFYMLKAPSEDASRLATAISEVKTHIFFCGICGNITDSEPCHICANPERDHKVVCVIEEPDDLLAIERTNGYKGVYHVLMGVISPLDGIGPRDLRIDSLFERIESQDVKEVILADKLHDGGAGDIAVSDETLVESGCGDYANFLRDSRGRRS